MEGNLKRIEEIQEKNFSRRRYGLAGVFLGILFLFLFGAVYTAFKTHKPASNPTGTSSSVSAPLADATIVYGYWTDNASVIKAFDLNSNKEAELMRVGKNIKHVKVIDGNTLIYLKDTDIYDYGKKLVIRHIENNKETTVIESDEGFGIDDYQVSPNGNYAAVWMVGISSGKVQFSGSASRVYSVDIRNGESHLLYDETTENNNPVNYPLAVGNDGTIYTDKFLPNSGAGWGYGMSISDFSGLDKKEISSMMNGTFSTQPVMSSDGKYLAFAGYSGKDGTIVKNGYRKALTMPDTIELLDLTTLTRTKINTGLKKAIYSSINWDVLSGKLLFEAFENDSNNLKTSVYVYSPSSRRITALNDNPKLDFINLLPDEKYLMGQKFQSLSGTGNLGPKYSLSINKFFIVNDSDLSQNPIPIFESPVQFLGIEPKNYFPIVEQKGTLVDSTHDKKLKLQTFEIKPNLAPKRLIQQSDPLPSESTPSDVPELPQCRTITYPQCNQLLGTNYPQSKDLSEINDPAFADCIWQKQAEVSASCLDSPLYLYGEKGTQVKVRVGTEAYNFNVKTKNNIIDVTLGSNGMIDVEGNSVSSITFDYFSKVKNFPKLEKGWIVSSIEKEEKVKLIGEKLGLIQNEIADLVSFISGLKSPYLFVSFYDQNTSHEILPLYFKPHPDNYKNIVIYIKKLNKKPDVLPAEPKPDLFTREGFTAVEISYIVE